MPSAAAIDAKSPLKATNQRVLTGLCEGLLRDMAGRLEQEMARIERETGSPSWSPWPAYGFRLWQIGDDGLYGAWARWLEPEITAECRSERVGTDIPVPHLNDV